MTLATAYWCVLIAAVLPYAWVVVAKTRGERYNNHDPRGWLQRQESRLVRRANGAHLNAFEAFAPFAAGVVMAQLAGVPHSTIAKLSIAFVLARMLHGLLYLADRHRLRSVAWALGYGCALTLLAQAAIAA
jgi:uncharacterized MAPEG superfamily protein